MILYTENYDMALVSNKEMYSFYNAFISHHILFTYSFIDKP